MSIYVKIAFAVLVVTLISWAVMEIFDEGAQQAINQIEKQDRSAVNAADQASNTRRACIAAGRMWDVSSGQCVGR